jgi:hypothetical protein
MKRIVLLLALLLVPSLAFGMGSAPKTSTPAPSSTNYPYLIDNFEDGDFNRAPEWWKFDNISPVVEKSVKFMDGEPDSVSRIGANFLHVTGKAANWYCGGLGVYLGLDASKYRSLEMDVYGNGDGSGQMKIEFYDDDNNNFDVEVDKNYVPLYDDLWTYTLNVNWKGWKHISVPFESFTLANPGKGNGVWDSSALNGSSGLNKMQMIFLGTKQVSTLNIGLANLELGSK